MSEQFLQHITRDGDRWDLIAFDYYGDASLIAPLLKANAELLGHLDRPSPLVFDKGVTLRVPVLDVATTQQSQLPPWKRLT
jgi:phage tail protein X